MRRGVYAVGRPELTREGRFNAAVLACGPGAALSHSSAAALWGIRPGPRGLLEVSIPNDSGVRPPDLRVHRRRALTTGDVTQHRNIPVTTPVCTLIDLASRLSPYELEAAVNQADAHGLVDPEELRAALDRVTRPGAAKLRKVLDRRTFAFTRPGLEQHFLPITRRAGLPKPLTNTYVNGFEVDFHWPHLNLVIETDGLTYHRTPQQQARDRERDQTHTAAGLTCLRFTHGQIKYEPARVTETLAAVASRLRRQDDPKFVTAADDLAAARA